MATLMTVLIGLGILGVLVLGGRSVSGAWSRDETGTLLACWSKRRESLENMIADFRHDRDTRTLSEDEYQTLSQDAETRLDEARRLTGKLERARYSRIAQRGRKVPDAVRRQIDGRVAALRRARMPH